MIRVYLPSNIKTLCLNNSYVYLYNLNIFFLFNYKNYDLFFNNYLNLLKFNPITYSNPLKINKKLSLFIFNWDNFFFSKIYFIGKGFKIKKFEKTTHFNFIYSHKNIILNNTTLIKKIEKTKLLLISKNYNKLIKLINTVLSIKPLNSYTKRGIRKTKQIFYKKKNKSMLNN